MRPRRTLPAALSRPYSSHAALAPRFPGGVLIPDTNEVGTREATGPDAAGWPGRARLVLGLDLRLFFLRLSLTFPRLIFPLVVFHFPSVLPFSSCLYLISPQFVSFVTAPFSLTPLFSLVLPHFSFALSCFNCPLSHFLSISFLFLAVPFISPIDLPHFLPVSIFPLVSPFSFCFLLFFPWYLVSFPSPSFSFPFFSLIPPHFLSFSLRSPSFPPQFLFSLQYPLVSCIFPHSVPHFPLFISFPLWSSLFFPLNLPHFMFFSFSPQSPRFLLSHPHFSPQSHTFPLSFHFPLGHP